MADKGSEDTSRTSSRSTSDSEDVSDDERDDSVIQYDLQTEMGDQIEENATAVDDFLEQVSGSTPPTTTTRSSHHPDPDACRTARAAAKDHSGEQRQQAKRTLGPPECRCQLNGGRPCHTRFGAGELMEVRAHYLGLRRGEVDIAVLAKLECGIHLTPMTTRRKRRPTARLKHRTDFYHRGFRICNVMFVYLHGFSYKKLKALIVQYKTNGVRTRVHKNIKPRPAETPVLLPKRTKSQAKAKLTAKEPRARKQVEKKGKKTGRAEGGKGEVSSMSPLCQNSVRPPSSPPPALPAPPVQPPHPVTFPLPTHPHPHHHPAHPLHAPFPPQPAGYSSVGGASVFTPHPMTLHTPPTPHHQPPSVLPSLSTASVDYCGQPGMTSYPGLDFSCSRTSGHAAAYSVLPNVTL